MERLFFAASAAVLALAATVPAVAQPEPQAVVLPAKVEQVTGAAHLTYRDAAHNTVFEANLVSVGEVPAFDVGCRMRDSAQDAAPAGPKAPTSEPRKPPHADDMATARPRGRWTACS